MKELGLDSGSDACVEMPAIIQAVAGCPVLGREGKRAGRYRA